MGYVEGESLKDRLEREGPLPLDEAVRLIAEVGEALQYAHERGIVHRDIKPANILISRSHALVADFGIAKAISGDSSEHTLTGTGISVGTVEYMSPEQAAGEKRLDGRSDVYALGVLLYELLVGEPPFTGPTVQAVVARIIADPPRRLRTVRASIPEHIEQAVLSALSKIPADRPPTAQAFTDRLLQPSAVQGLGAGKWLAVAGVVALVAVAALLMLRGRPRTLPRPARPAGVVLVPSGRYPVGGSAPPEADGRA
jgi:serine/threonine-protein kinase